MWRAEFAGNCYQKRHVLVTEHVRGADTGGQHNVITFNPVDYNTEQGILLDVFVAYLRRKIVFSESAVEELRAVGSCHADFNLIVTAGPHVTDNGLTGGRFGVEGNVYLDFYFARDWFMRAGAGLTMDFLAFGGGNVQGGFQFAITGPYLGFGYSF